MATQFNSNQRKRVEPIVIMDFIRSLNGWGVETLPRPTNEAAKPSK